MTGAHTCLQEAFTRMTNKDDGKPVSRVAPRRCASQDLRVVNTAGREKPAHVSRHSRSVETSQVLVNTPHQESQVKGFVWPGEAWILNITCREPIGKMGEGGSSFDLVRRVTAIPHLHLAVRRSKPAFSGQLAS